MSTFKKSTSYIEHERLQTDLRYFCKRALTIKLKEGGEGQFIWNRAQEYLHKRIEEQRARTGRVRIYVLKGRQQGASTYIAARFYHKITRQRAKNVFILSHHSTTTEALFSMVEKYHDNCPQAITPRLMVNNSRRMKFANKSQYTVATAGTGAIGRGDTNQYFHWSEVAFCENIGQLLTGAFQTVADIDDTEKILESTANGVGNYFHKGCMAALSGQDEYEIVFIPWYWQLEYRARLRPDFEVTDEEQQLKDLYNLDDSQLQWRRNKIQEFEKDGFGGSKFKQEYPCTIQEAFQHSGSTLINPDKVAAAKKSNITDVNAPLILGVDPGPVNDRTAITWRQGRKWIKTESFVGMSPMTLASKIADRIDRHSVAKVFIDVAEGRGVIDRLHQLGYGDVVIGIPFAQSPIDEERYVNKRAEMAGLLKEWLEDDLGVSIPDDDEIEVEIGAIPEFKTTSNGKLQLVAKDEIKKVYGKSPDLFDSAMLTFAQPVRNTYNENKRVKKRITRQASELNTLNRRRQTEKPKESWDDELNPQITRQSPVFRRRS